jgi:hypothetical protein
VGPAEDPHVVFAVTAIEPDGFDVIELQKRSTFAAPSVEADERTAKALLIHDRPL